MANFSFDIVSEVDLQEMDNALIRRIKNCSSGMTLRTVRLLSPMTAKKRRSPLLLQMTNTNCAPLPIFWPPVW